MDETLLHAPTCSLDKQCILSVSMREGLMWIPNLASTYLEVDSMPLLAAIFNRWDNV